MAHALLNLIEHSRHHQHDFDFGPLDLNEAMKVGLLVRGRHVEEAAAVLRRVPGLEEVPR